MNPDLVHMSRSLALTLLISAGLLTLAPFFFIGGPDWASSSLDKAVWNLGHIAFFALVTLLLQLRWGIGGIRQASFVTVAVFSLGLLIEFLQSYAGRDVSWADVLRNLTGAWLVLAWRRPVPALSRPGRQIHWLGRAAVLLLLTVQLLPVLSEAQQHLRLARQLPRLANFEDPAALGYWSGNVTVVSGHSLSGRPSLAIQLDTDRYSGTFLKRLPTDWTGYRHLEFNLYNPADTAIQMTLRINDLQHDRGSNAYSDRYNGRIALPPGWSRHRIDLDVVAKAPATRRMDMGSIRRLGLFTSNLPAPQLIFLDDLRLTTRRPND